MSGESLGLVIGLVSVALLTSLWVAVKAVTLDDLNDVWDDDE
jgi:hypothetical protein